MHIDACLLATLPLWPQKVGQLLAVMVGMAFIAVQVRYRIHRTGRSLVGQPRLMSSTTGPLLASAPFTL
jgi:hypothetical protein